MKGESKSRPATPAMKNEMLVTFATAALVWCLCISVGSLVGLD
jgi:hypothetical protein